MSQQIKQFTQQLLTIVFSHQAFTVMTFLAVILTAWMGVQAQRNNGEQEIQNMNADRVLEIDDRSWPKGVIELVEVKDWQSLDFPKGLEIKVRNISTKPIYYCHIVVILPESATADSIQHGLPMFYGDRRLISLLNTPLMEKDTPIPPGEIITLLAPQANVDHFYRGMDENKRVWMKEKGLNRILLIPQLINFGDGTGYVTSKPYPRVSKISFD